ncbi:hypothetical protein CC99x_000375 [Candidatus Berkiella cookevillensis]|uniref:Uncharacterized protein n=1 Tax=Candidatus Berkiella cookevillensis TaxID=437022 RepID=A0A0Q9Y936_9GAMM|nr:hypothetical protein [Candidatus Berkiella cookevillensis]MCS5707348.1 hypothetical protein [Candidatus Berkiella cookevillensis]
MFVALCGVLAFFIYISFAKVHSPFGIIETAPNAFLFAIAVSTIVFCIRRSMRVKQFFSIFILRAVALSISGYMAYALLWIVVANHKLYLISQMSTEELDVMYETLKHQPCDRYNAHLLAEISVKTNTSSKTLEKIAKNEGVCLVQAYALWSGFVSSGTGNYQGNPVKRLVAQNANTNAKTLEYLYSLKDFYITASVARNVNTPVKILEQIYREYGHNMGFDLAINPNTPAYILSALSDTDNQYVKEYIAKNPNTPPEIKKKVMEGLP